MANIWNIASKGLLATGISGFPVGVSSFAHSSKFSNNKQMTAQKAALEQSTKFLNEEKDKLTKTKNKEDTLSKELRGSDGLEAKLIKQNKEIANGADEGSENSSKSLQKMIKRGMYSCENYESKGLTRITERFKFGDEEKEITYCYYSECYGKLFLKNNFEEISSSNTIFRFSSPKEGCFSISLKNDEGNKKITGSIKLGLKNDTFKKNGIPDAKIGAILVTEFELHKNNTNSDKFENTFILLETHKGDQDWKIKEKNTWNDSHQNKYTYDYLKNKFSGEFKKLEIWKAEENPFLGAPDEKKLMRESMLTSHLNLFDKGSDLWNWKQDNIANKQHFEKWNEKIWIKLVNPGKSSPGVWTQVSI